MKTTTTVRARRGALWTGVSLTKMAAVLTQLNAFGNTSVLLNVDEKNAPNDGVTLFKKPYFKHDNFASQPIRVDFNRSDCFLSEKTQFRVQLPRHGDLLINTYLVLDIPLILSDADKKFRWVQDLGEAIIDSYQISVGGSLVDKQDGQYLHLCNQLKIPRDKRRLYDEMTGNVPTMFAPSDPSLANVESTLYVGDKYPASSDSTSPSIKSTRLYVPLNFWFSRAPWNAFPLVASKYSAVEIVVTLRPLNTVYLLWYTPNGASAPGFYPPNSTDRSHDLANFVSVDGDRRKVVIAPGLYNLNVHLNCKYVFLDSLKRTKFAKSEFEYLVDQVNRTTWKDLGASALIDLHLRNPVKEVIFVLKRTDSEQLGRPFDFSDEGDDILQEAQLLFAGNPRFDSVDATYFDKVQHYECHPESSGKPGVYVYSFALYPDDDGQPSGSVNMSAIPNVQLALSLRKPRDPTYKYQIDVYAVNWNWVRVMSGIAALMFAT